MARAVPLESRWRWLAPCGSKNREGVARREGEVNEETTTLTGPRDVVAFSFGCDRMKPVEQRIGCVKIGIGVGEQKTLGVGRLHLEFWTDDGLRGELDFEIPESLIAPALRLDLK